MTTTEHHAIDLSDEQVEVLDNLVWSSLNSTHARFAEGAGLARRFDPDVAGFVGAEAMDAVCVGRPAATRRPACARDAVRRW